ncbi:MAG: hypothetical protein WCG14_03775 [Chlamydiia bacterium]
MIYDFTLFVSATLVGNWVWDLWTRRSAVKEHKKKMLKSCLEKIEHCSHELDYNAAPGIGESRCPFTTEAQQKLLYSEENSLLGGDVTISLKNLIINVGKANGGSPSVTSNGIKKGSMQLKEVLQQRGAELQNSAKSKR